MDRNGTIRNILGNMNRVRKDFTEGFSHDYGKGREDEQVAFYEARRRQGKQKEGPRLTSMLATNPTIYRIREALGVADPDYVEARKDMGMGLMDNKSKVSGQILGTLAADVTQDTTRSVYWLLNALQATGGVINEAVLAKANPNLYGKTAVINEDSGDPLRKKDRQQARSQGIYEEVAGKERLKRGYSYADDSEDPQILKRNFEPGHIASLAIPTGIAINNGLGLLTPGGGAEGYYAVLPSEDDPTKTSNMLGEVALKYVMGRTGNMLPYEEFKKVRPDITPEEYRAYKAFKYDKKEDWNPLDGDMTIGAGALKFTNEGLHGPEVQFLGRSLPVTTGVVPFAGALAGGALGVRTGRPILGGFGGGMAGLAAGTASGNLLEEERRRRNQAENELKG
tara:strand:+ start:1486 stop:2670 length:1185 start_codon:yes stop_codon:yes gene_type:complete